MLLRVLPLFAVLGVGALAGALRLFPAPAAAIAVLNRFALYVAFPMLVVASLGSGALALPEGPGFYLVHLLAAAAQLAIGYLVVARATRSLRRERAAIVVGSLFGNIAYLGIPFCASVLGAHVVGIASLSAAIHIVIGMTVSPALLLRERAAGSDTSLARLAAGVARQPLVWSPFVGLVVRQLPATVQSPLLAVMTPIGAAAGPVALFMLGLYLFVERRRLLALDLPAAVTCACKLALYPALTAAALAAVRPFAPLSLEAAQVVVLVSAMPTAVTAFALSEEYGTGRETVAYAIVLSTVVSLATLPALAAWVTG